jgi:tetratricopeptide (TPR) repeat protein
LPAGLGGVAEDGTGQVVGKANYILAHVLTPERAFKVGPLDNCRAVAVSPDGEWLATGSHGKNGAQVWRVRDGRQVAHLAIEGLVGVLFSPDGKWLMTTNPPCRLWAVGAWSEPRRIDGYGLCFAPDGRLLVIQDASKILRLVETETGRRLARLESPDLCAVKWATFSPDGSRLVITTDDGRGVHAWDLRAIRRHLTEMGLDWDAPPLPTAEDSTGDAEGRPSLEVDVDFGSLRRYSEQYKNDLEQYTVPSDELVNRYTERLRAHPDDPDSLHQRAHALLRLDRFEEALDDFSAALALRPLDAHLRAYRGVCLFDLKRYAPSLDELEAAFRTDPETVRAIIPLARFMNERAWELASGAEPQRDPVLAARLAAFAVALSPAEQTSLNTLGVALYRAGRFAEAIEMLGKSLKAGEGQFDGFDLFFLAMAHHRLGHEAQARACFDRATRWLRDQKSLPEEHARELAAFRVEAESVLAGPVGELPAAVFAGQQ